MFIILIIYLVCCAVESAVNNREPNLKVAVNGVVIRTTDDVDIAGYKEKHAVYFYELDDLVDVFCMIPQHNEHCTVHIRYDYAEKLHDTFRKNKMKSEYGVGFRSKLNNVHNRSQMICNIFCDDQEVFKVKVDFVLKTWLDDILDFKFQLSINGATIRGFTSITRDRNRPIYEIEYIYSNDLKRSEICCQKKRSASRLKQKPIDSKQKCVSLGKDSENIVFRNLLCNLSPSYLRYDDRDKIYRITLSEYIQNESFSDKSNKLFLDLPTHNTILDMYEYGWRNVIYYEYQHGEQLKLSCETRNNKNNIIFMKFNNIEYNNRNRVLISEKFTSDSDYALRCYSTENERSETVIRQIDVLFHNRKADGVFKLPIVLGILALIVATIVICSYVCYYKNQRPNPKETIYENLEAINIQNVNNEIPVSTISNQMINATQNLPRNPLPPQIPQRIKRNFEYANLKARRESEFMDYVEPYCSTISMKANKIAKQLTKS